LIENIFTKDYIEKELENAPDDKFEMTNNIRAYIEISNKFEDLKA